MHGRWWPIVILLALAVLLFMVPGDRSPLCSPSPPSPDEDVTAPAGPDVPGGASSGDGGEDGSAEERARTPKAGPVRVTGVVLDAGTEEPVAGAAVALHRHEMADVYSHSRPYPCRDLAALGSPLDRSVTGADGRFSIVAPPSEDLVVVIRAKGYADCADSISVGEAPLEIHLLPVTVLEFRVVDPDRIPVPGAWVLVYPAEFLPPVRDLRADADGLVVVPVAEAFGLVFRAPGFESRILSCPLEAESLTVVLRRGLPIAGVAVDTEGQPVAGATVSLGLYGRDELRTTDEKGRFRFEAVAGDEDGWGNPLEARKESLFAEEQEVYPGDTGVRVVLVRRATLEGIVVDPHGDPVSSAELSLRRDRDWESRRGIKVDGDGGFRISNVAPGPHLLTGWRRRILTAPQQGFVYDMAGKLTVEATEGAWLSGLRLVLRPQTLSYAVIRLVSRSGTPTPEALVHTWGASSGGEWGYRTDADGRIVLPLRAPPGTEVEIRVRPRNKEPPFGLPGPAGKVLTIDRPDGEASILCLPATALLTVTVRTSNGKALPPRVEPTLAVRPDSLRLPEPDTSSRLLRLIRTDVGFHVEVRAPGYAPWSAWFPAPGAEEVGVEAVLTPGAAVRGRVLRPDGLAAAEVWVTLHAEEGQRWAEDGITVGTDDEGCFSLSDLPAGGVMVVVAATTGREAVLARLDLAVGEETDMGELRIPASTKLPGRVTDDKGRPVAGVRVVHRLATEARRLSHTFTDGAGSFELPITGLPVGLVQLSRAGFGAVLLPLAERSLGRRLDVRMEREIRVTLWIRNPPRDTSNLRVTAIRTRDGLELPPWGTLVPPPEARGRVGARITELPAEPMTIRVELPNPPRTVLWRASVDVNPAPGQSVEIPITLER